MTLVSELGKTKVAIDFTAIKHMKKDVTRALIVCPLSALGVWEDELELDMPVGYKAIVLTGSVDEKAEVVKAYKRTNELVIFITNYDSLIPRQRGGKKTESPLLKALIKFEPQMLIVDEMHYAKNGNAERTKAVYKIRKLAHWVMGLTGTPMPKNPLDIFGQYKILDETIFGTNFTKFRNEYAVMGGYLNYQIIDWKNMKEMAKKIHSIAYRVKDTEAENLPELIIQDIPVYFTDKTKKLYTQMAKEMIVELENGEDITAAIAIVKIQKLQQICGGFIMRNDIHEDANGNPVVDKRTFPVGTEKMDVFMELVDKYIDKHQMIIGCRFVWEINQIEANLRKKYPDHDFAVIKGGVSGEDRANIKRKFQSDPNLKAIIFQVGAATAMTLTAGDVGILYSCSRKWDDYWQWLKRIHRDGQTKSVLILRLLVRGTIDYEIVKGLNEKRQFTEDLVDKSKYRDILLPKF